MSKEKYRALTNPFCKNEGFDSKAVDYAECALRMSLAITTVPATNRNKVRSVSA